MKIHLAALFAIATAPLSWGAADARLDGILRSFNQREYEDADSIEAHRKWAGSETAKADLAYLAEHYDDLSAGQRDEIPMELARTGRLAVVPLLKKALADPRGKSALSGIFYACNLSKPEDGFGKAVAPLLVPLVEKHDRAVELLPTLDPEVAKATLLTDAWLGPDSPKAKAVLRAFNQGGVAVPLERVRPLLSKWQKPSADAGNWDMTPYGVALLALARIEPGEAVTKADECVASDPTQSEDVAEVYLVAAGLGDLRSRLFDLTETPADLAKLPKPAVFFYAINYFESDWMNGGISQVLSNSTGDLLPWVREGYKAIGDELGTRHIERVCAAFGPNGPSTNREKRNQQMEQMKPPFGELEEKWEEELAKEMKEKSSIPTEVLLNRYAAKHADVLKPLLTKP